MPLYAPFFAPDGTVSSPGIAFASEQNTGFMRWTSGSVAFTSVGNGTVGFLSSGIRNGGNYQWCSGSPTVNSSDLFLVRDAANNLAQRNGPTAQVFRVYATFTDASNYERITLSSTAGTSGGMTIETAGTGGDNLDLTLTPAGTGLVRFGSFAAGAGETFSGTISIKDAAGNTRKIAVFA